MRTILLGLLSSVAAIALTLLGLEGIARGLSLDHHYLPPRVDRHSRQHGSPTPLPGSASPISPFATVVSTYSTDPRGYFDEGGRILHHHNDRGYRDEVHEREKPPETYRIVGLGDSYLWGQGVRAEDRILTQLAQALEPGIEGRAIETLNLGVSGANTEDELRSLTQDGLPYDPDLVILFFVLNDIVPRESARFDLEFTPDFEAIVGDRDWLGRRSQLWAWARQRYRYQVIAKRYIEDTAAGFSAESMDWRHARQLIGEMNARCAEADVPFLVVIFPYFYHLNGDYPFAHAHEVIGQALGEDGIPVFDLQGSFPGYDGPELWVHPTDQHPNEIAHGIAAEAVADHLLADPERWGM